MANKSVGLLNFVFGANLTSFERAMKKADKLLTKVSRNMKKVGKQMTMNLTLPIVAVGAGAVKMASDFEETDSKFKTVFSSMQKEAESTAQSFKENFGLSELAAKDMLGATGDLLVGFGFTEDKALELSNSVNELAVDLASFTNFSGGAKGASEALTKALLGERESIKSLGIAITETDLKAYAADQGLVWKNLDRVTKATLTFEMAQQQSSKAIGDFGRTKEQFANQVRIVKGQVQDLAVKFGKALLPIAEKLLQVFKSFIDRLSGLSDTQMQWIVTIGLTVAAIGPLIFAGGLLISMVNNLGKALVFLAKNPIILLISMLVTLATVFIDTSQSVGTNWDRFINFLIRSVNDIIWAINKVIDALNAASIAVGGDKLLNNIEELEERELELAEAADAVSVSFQDMSEQMSLADQVAQEQESTLNNSLGTIIMFTQALKDAEGNLGAQEKILKDLKKVSPEYFGELKAGKGLYDKLSKATALYVEALKEQAKQEVLLAKLKPLYSSLAEQLLAKDDLQKEWKEWGDQMIRERAKYLGDGKWEGLSPLDKLSLSNKERKKKRITREIKEINEEIDKILALAGGTDILGQILAGEEDDKKDKTKEKTPFEKALEEYEKTSRERQTLAKNDAIEREFTKKQTDEMLYNLELEHLQGLAELQDKFEEDSTKTYEKIADMKLKAFNDEPVNKYAGALGKLGEKISKLTHTDIKELEAGFKSVMEELSDALGQGADSFEEYGKHVLQVLKDIIGGLIAKGVTAAVAGALEKVGAFGPAGVFMIPIVAGLAAGLAQTAFNSLIPQFAQGGLVTGPTQAIVGEGSGTSMSNPEVIAPLDKLKKYIGGGDKVQVEGIIRGNDIFLSNARTKLNRKRTA